MLAQHIFFWIDLLAMFKTKKLCPGRAGKPTRLRGGMKACLDFKIFSCKIIFENTPRARWFVRQSLEASPFRRVSIR